MDMRQGVKKVKGGVIHVKDSVLGGIGKGFDTVTGKAVLEKVTKYAQETDAVNTAIVTRIYQILDHETKLEKAINRTRRLAIVSVVLNVLCGGLIVYLLLKGK